MSVDALARQVAPLADAIARLQADDPIPALLGRPPWTRTYGRIDPRGACYATLVYERTGAEPVRVDLHERAVSDAHGLPAPLGWAQLQSCRADPALPTLAQAHRRYRMDRIVRYRPGKRCTMRGSKDGAPAFIKVFADDRGADLAGEGVLLHEAAAAGRLGFTVARCLGWDGELRAIAHEALAGAPVVETLLGGGIELAAALARALASLPNSHLAPARAFGAAEQMARTRRYARKLAHAAPDAAGPAEALTEALAQAHAAAPDTEPRAIHGAPHPHQWLADGDRLALVDFDRLSFGPVEIDAATFVAELDFESSSVPPLDAVSSAFLDAYSETVGGCDPRVLAIYRAHKHLAKAFKVALSISTAREARAHRILTRAHAMLREAMQ